MREKIIASLAKPIPMWLLLLSIVLILTVAFTVPQTESNNELTNEQKATAITTAFNERTDGEATLTGITEVERVYLVYWQQGNTTGKSLLIGSEWLDFSSRR